MLRATTHWCSAGLFAALGGDEVSMILRYYSSLGEPITADHRAGLRKIPDYVLIGKTSTGTHTIRTEWTGVDASLGKSPSPWTFKATVTDDLTGRQVFTRTNIDSLTSAQNLHIELVIQHLGTEVGE